MSYNIGHIILDELKGNAQYVDAQTYLDRMNICEKCDYNIEVVPLMGRKL
jgi:hypothetical protein